MENHSECQRPLVNIFPVIHDKYGWIKQSETNEVATAQSEGAILVRRELKILKTRERNLSNVTHLFTFDTAVMASILRGRAVIDVARVYKGTGLLAKSQLYESRARAEKAYSRRVRTCAHALFVAQGKGPFEAEVKTITAEKEEFIPARFRVDIGPLSTEALSKSIKQWEPLIRSTARRYANAHSKHDACDLENELRLICCKVMQTYNPEISKHVTVLRKAFLNRLISIHREIRTEKRYANGMDFSLDMEVRTNREGEPVTLHDVVGTEDAAFEDLDNRLALQRWLKLAPERHLAYYGSPRDIIAEMRR